MEVVLIVLFVLWLAVCVLWPAAIRRRAKQSPPKAIEVPFGPNDILLIETPDRMSREQMDRVRSQIRLALSQENLNLMVLEGGMTAKVLRRTPTSEQRIETQYPKPEDDDIPTAEWAYSGAGYP